MTDPISFVNSTSGLSLPLLFAGQAQKEFTVNQAISLIDVLLQKSVEAAFEMPPPSPLDGSAYRVLPNASGLWTGRGDCIAAWIGGDWHFVVPTEGMAIHDRALSQIFFYSSGWQQVSRPQSPQGGAIIDVEARSAIEAIITGLIEHGIFSAQSQF